MGRNGQWNDIGVLVVVMGGGGDGGSGRIISIPLQHPSITDAT